MPTTMPITAFRKNLFEVAGQVNKTGIPVVITWEGQENLVLAKDDLRQRTRYVIDHILPKLAGIWKDVPQKEFDRVNEQLRGKKARRYLDSSRFQW